MTSPIVISGTTGALNERRFCQFWGPYKIAGREQDECLASMSTSEGLRIDAQCPQEWLAAVWDAFTFILAGGVPASTHTVRWNFGRPTFTLIETSRPDPETTLFDLDGTEPNE